MKKRHLFPAAAIFVLMVAAIPLYSAEVTEKQDIAIFGLAARTFDIPADILLYIDNSMNNVFVNLKRFNVLGYGDYRIEAEYAEEFIARIREARAQKAAEAGTYDEKFGTIVIKGEDFDRIANSFLLVMPSLSSYDVESRREVVLSGDVAYYKWVHTVAAVIDITFINVREGKQEEAIRITGTGSGEDVAKAGRLAVDGAIASLGPKIRQTETFKIKSGVILVRGDTVTFELGKDIGVKPGDEFEVMTKQEIGETGRIVVLPTGLVRVRKTYPEVSEARIVYQKERITEGDQLVEVAKAGVQLSFNAGVMKVDIPDMNYAIAVVDDAITGSPPPYPNTYFMNLDQNEVNLAPLVGLTVEKSLGYRYKAIFDGTALLNFPLFGGFGELGVGAIFQQRRASLELSALGGLLYMTTFQQTIHRSSGTPDSMRIENVTIHFYDDPVMTIYGLSGGVKGKAGFTFLVKPGLALKLAAAYRFYTPISNWTVRIVETTGDKDSVNLSGDSPNIVESPPTSGRMKQVNISGYELTMALTLRF